MTELLIRNARIAYPGLEGFVVDQGWLLARDGCIAALGSAAIPVPDAGQDAARVELDAAGMTLLPGLVNAHMHLYSLYARGIITGRQSRDFIEVLRDLWWRLDRSLLKDACWMSAVFSGMDSLRSGTTTIIDHHASPNYISGSLSTLSDGLSTIGLRHVLSYEVTDRNGLESAQKGIEENLRFLDHASGLGSGMIGLHASFTVSARTMKAIRNAVGSRQVGYHIHVAEGPIDEDDSLKRYGKRVVARLAEAGFLGPRSLAVHCVGVDEFERSLLAQTQTPVVVNAMSNMNNAVGLPGVREMIADGIRVGIGTDGYGASMQEACRNLLVSLRHRYGDPAGFWLDVQRSQVETNPLIASEATGQLLGHLETGAAADLILVDYASPTSMNGENVFGHLFFGMSPDLVDTVIVNGNVVVRHHRVLGIDTVGLERESKKVAMRVWKEFNRLT